MNRQILLCMMALCSVMACAKESLSDKEIATRYQPSFVQVEYTLKYDKADYPEVPGWAQRCPNCGSYHSFMDGSEIVLEERPLESFGLVLSKDQILAPDFMVHSRFIEKIAVRYGDQVIPAAITSYMVDQPACILKLEKALEGIKPLSFSDAKEPYKILSRTQVNGKWLTSISKMQTTYALTDDQEAFSSTSSLGLIVDSNGNTVAVNFSEIMPQDDSWKQTPLSWKSISAEQMETMIGDFEKRLDAGLLRVKLMLRSPKKSSMDRYYYDDDESATEIDAHGLVINPSQILVMTKLSPKVTARLEKVLVFTDGKQTPIEGDFAGTLTDYGAFAATLKTPLEESPVSLSTENIGHFVNTLLVSAEIRIQGENRTLYIGRNRIASLDFGWKKQLVPELPGSTENLYLFDLKGRLLAMPLERRKKVETEEDRWMMYDETNLVACSYMQPVLTALKDHINPDIIPLTEEEENRIAWLGVEMQELNDELAQINKISNITDDGETGAIVSYIYDGSPAAEQGIQVGDIFLRIHVAGQPRPLEVRLHDEYGFGYEQFPWEYFDELTEEYFDQLPMPWPDVENDLIRSITDLGFGKTFEAEIYRNGETIRKQFTVTQSPPHYESAKRYASEPIGITVRNITYEVKRYFRCSPDDPGVIISKVNPGSKASVSGIKPYEIVTHVSDKPVYTVDDFETLTQAGGQLKLSVKRMTKGRVVNLSNIDQAVSSKDSDNKPLPEEVNEPKA